MRTTTKKTTIEQVLARVIRFQDRGLAMSFAARATKPMGVILGDDERYWVATMADCARLERAGYEWAL